MLSKKHHLLLWMSLVLLYGLTGFLYSRIPPSSDVMWQMQLARSVLHGGNYIQNFFETTPPLSFLILIPEVAVEKIGALSHATGIYTYIFLCTTITLLLSYPLIKKLIAKEDGAIATTFLIAIAFVCLVVPGSAFGQREHFFVLFSIPYFLLSACRLDNKWVHPLLALTIGLLGAIGFSIKPFFLASFILIESAVAIAAYQQKKYRFHPETGCVLIFLPIYLLVIDIFFKPYLSIVVPITMRFYYQSFATDSWIDFIKTPAVIFSIFPIIFYFLMRSKNPYQKLSTILFLALTGNFIAFLVQRINWYYHLLPAFSIAVLLNFFLLSVYLKTNRFIATRIAVSVFVCYYPLYFLVLHYLEAIIFWKKDVYPVVSFLRKTEQNREVYFFSTQATYFFSSLEIAGAHHQSRFEFLLWMRNYHNKQYVKQRTSQQKKDADYLTGLLAEDLIQHKPDLIFVDESTEIDYLHFLNKNTSFQTAWKKYYFLCSAEEKNMYHFNVYARAQSLHPNAIHYSLALNPSTAHCFSRIK